MAPSRYDWKIVDWDVKPQHNQPTNQLKSTQYYPQRKFNEELTKIIPQISSNTNICSTDIRTLGEWL